MSNMKNLFTEFESVQEALEFAEFLNAYKAFKAMKTGCVESARTTATAVNTIDKVYDEGRLVQVGNDVIDLGITKKFGDVKTDFKMHEQTDINGKKYYCIKSGMCTKKKKLDKNGQPILNKWGKQDYYRFNLEAYEIAKNIIKSVDGIITIDVPFRDKAGNVNKFKKPWFAWGFKTKKQCQEVLCKLPKVIKAEEIENYLRGGN